MEKGNRKYDLFVEIYKYSSALCIGAIWRDNLTKENRKSRKNKSSVLSEMPRQRDAAVHFTAFVCLMFNVQRTQCIKYVNQEMFTLGGYA